MAKIGRARIEIDPEKLEKLMNFWPSIWTVSGFFDCDRKVITTYIREHYDLTFREFRKKYSSSTKIKIVEKAREKALAGDNEMIKLMLANMDGWQSGYMTHKSMVDDEDYIDTLDFVDDL
jgi:hypothetical protein